MARRVLTFSPPALRRGTVAAGLLFMTLGAAAADTIYQEPAAFVREAFEPGAAGEPAFLWLTGDLRTQAARILGHEPGARVRYWKAGSRTAWILEEIGKEEPITMGFVVESGRVQRVQVLIYRESRGWEVRFPAFTRQFENAALTPEFELDRSIDNISGATLSVNALRRLARVALLYHAQVTS